MEKNCILQITLGRTSYYGYPVWFALLLTFCVGFSSGLFGIGGGSILVPAMILLFLFPPHVAVGTSMFMVLLSALVNSTTHIALRECAMALYNSCHSGSLYRGKNRGTLESEDEIGNTRCCIAYHASFTRNQVHY